MNKDKFIAFRVSNAEYEVIKNKSKELGFKNVSLYARKKMLTDEDEYLYNVNRIRNLYDHLARLEMEFETIKNEAGLSEHENLNYETEFVNIKEHLNEVK
ncbi:plasmid mobilization protein [Holdemanella porci]|uniref:plasmid mobilization protein n=1 Tax=Holdemanella porci TaxID=2652276 RepID=UPI00388D2F9E